MREQLNNNPLVQLAVMGVLLLGAGFFFLTMSGGGEDEESGAGATEATVTVAGGEASGTATGATPGEAVEGAVDAATEGAGSAASLADALASVNRAGTAVPPPPKPVLRAWRANRTVVLLFVRNGGIDDALVKRATTGLAGLRDAAVFVEPASRISRYAAITQGVGVDRVPALVVVTPKHLEKTVPTASVSYGFQSPQSVTQAVIDAGYEGRTLDYHP